MRDFIGQFFSEKVKLFELISEKKNVSLLLFQLFLIVIFDQYRILNASKFVYDIKFSSFENQI